MTRKIEVDVMPEQAEREGSMLEALGQLREEVQEGEVREMFLVVGRESGVSVRCFWGEDLFSLVGILAVAQHDVVARLGEDQDGEKENGGDPSS